MTFISDLLFLWARLSLIFDSVGGHFSVFADFLARWWLICVTIQRHRIVLYDWFLCFRCSSLKTICGLVRRGGWLWRDRSGGDQCDLGRGHERQKVWFFLYTTHLWKQVLLMGCLMTWPEEATSYCWWLLFCWHRHLLRYNTFWCAEIVIWPAQKL